MYTFLLFIIFCASYLWYCTSSKIKTKSTLPFVQTLVQNKARSKYIAAALLTIAWSLTLYLQGPLSGSLAFVSYVMGVAGLIVLLAPYRYIQIKQVIILLVISFVFELFIF